MSVGAKTGGHHRDPSQKEEKVEADKAEETMVDHFKLASKTIKITAKYTNDFSQIQHLI